MPRHALIQGRTRHSGSARLSSGFAFTFKTERPMSMGSPASVARRLAPRSIKMKRARPRTAGGRGSGCVPVRLAGNQWMSPRGSWRVSIRRPYAPRYSVRSIPGYWDGYAAALPARWSSLFCRRQPRSAGVAGFGGRHAGAGPARELPIPWLGTVPGASRRGTRPRLVQARTACGHLLRPYTSNAA